MARRLVLPAHSHVDAQAGAWTVTCGEIKVPVEAARAGVRLALTRLVAGAQTEDDLCDLVLDAEGIEGLPAFFQSLATLAAVGLLRCVVQFDGGAAVTAVPWGPLPIDGAAPFDATAPVVLSRYAYLHQVGDALLIESPLTRVQIVLHDVRAAALVAVCAPGGTPDAMAAGADMAAPDALEILELLWDAGMLTGQASGDSVAHTPTPLDTWEFHDLLFHARSRAGRHSHPSGQTYRLRGLVERPPVVKASRAAGRIALPRLDLNAVAGQDPPLTGVIEARRSRREPGHEPITREQLGEFLFRTARLTAIVPLADSEVSRRPYPSGGASYELEIYPVVRECAGLNAGLYHYCARDHALDPWPCDPDDCGALVEGAAAAASAAAPQVLLIFAARFQRVSWKYSSIAYAVILKNVGALYQTMYLVAEAMGLAACAIGNGDADRFAQATGIDYYEEGSVGELMLSTRV